MLASWSIYLETAVQDVCTKLLVPHSLILLTLCCEVNAEGVRQIASALSTLAQEKQRMMKVNTQHL